MLGGSAITGFAVIRVLFGFAEGPAFSTINKSVSIWAAPRERALMSSLTLASTPVGAMITAPISVGLLRFTGDWRLMFAAVGLISLGLVLLFAITFSDRPGEFARHVNSAELAKINEPVPGLSQVAVFRGLRHAVVVQFLHQSDAHLQYYRIFCLPLHHLPAADLDAEIPSGPISLRSCVARYVGMIPWLGSCLTVVVGGRLSDRILSKTGSLVVARSWFAATVVPPCGLCFIAIPWAESAAGVIALMTVANALNTLPNAVYWIVVIDTSPRSRTGTNSGIMHLFAASASIIAPTLTGYLVERIWIQFDVCGRRYRDGDRHAFDADGEAQVSSGFSRSRTRSPHRLSRRAGDQRGA